MKKLFKPLVLVMLASSMAIVSCVPNRDEIDGIKNDIAALKDKVAANEVDVKAQIGTLQYLLQSYKDEVNPKLVALDAQLKKDFADLSAADAALSKAIKDAQTVLQAAIAKNSDDIAANKKEIQAAIAEYKKLVANAIEGFELAMAKAKEDQALVDGAQNMAIEALSAQFETFKGAVEEAIANLGESVDELAAAMEEMGEDIDDLKDQVDANLAASYAYTDALAVTVDAALGIMEERIAANEAAIKKLNEETIPGIEKAIEALQASIVGLEGNVAALDEKKLDKSVFEAFLKEHTEWKATIDNSIKSINGSIELLKIYDGIIAGSVEQLTDLVNRLNGSEVVPGSIKQQIKDAIAAVYESITKDLDALKTDIEGKIETLQTDIKSLKGSLELANAEIDIIHGNLEIVKNDLAAINDDIAAAQGDIKKLQEAKTKLEKDLKDLEDALEKRMKAVEDETAKLKTQIETINGDEKTEGSIAYAVEQLRASIQTQIDELAGKVNKNAEDIAKLQEEIGKLQQRIQSLVFVPEYQDLKFGIPFTKIGDTYEAFNTVQGFPVFYKIAPVELAKPIAKAINDAIAAGTTPVFTFDIESGLKTRAGDNDPMLIIKEAVGDEKTGKITLYLGHKNFEPKGGKLDQYAISLRADNDEYKVHVASEFVQAKLHQKAELQIQTDKLYKPDVTTGEAGESIVINNDPGVAEGTLSLSYTDGETHSYFDGYEMAAKDVTTGTIRTFSQWESMLYDMPTVTTTVTPQLDPMTSTENIVANTDAKPATFAIKIMDGLKDNMVETKKEIGKTNRYNYAFSDGTNTINAQLDVTIGQHTGAFQVKIPFTMTWDYAMDSSIDNNNKTKAASDWMAYHRETKTAGVPPVEVETFVATPTLTVDGKDLILDGSNKVYGLTVEDFAGKSFTPTTTPTPSVENEYTYNFNVVKHDVDKKTISLTEFLVRKVRLGKTYAFTGSYDLNAYSTEGVKADVAIATVDRKTDVIKITAPATNVKILGAEYTSGSDSYSIESADFADALMNAYIAQGILPEGFPKSSAFAAGGEFRAPTPIYSAEGADRSFGVNVNLMAGEESIKIKSEGATKLTSSTLHKIATGSDCEGEKNPWALEIETYVGQKVQIAWPISVAPKFDYKFVTYGITTADNSYQVNVEWIGAPTAITKAQTELDLVKDNDNIKVMYFNGTSENYIAYGDYDEDDFKLVPRFSLVEDKDGIEVVNSGTAALNCVSKVTYYGQVASVGIKSSLFVKSGDTEFYVPGSDKMYVNGTPVSSVTVKQANPIAAEQPAVTAITNIPTTPIVMLTMKDSEGFSIYADGAAQKDHAPYATGKTMKDIFNSIFFSIYSVNGSTSITGWALEGANEFGIVDTPTTVQLKTNGVAKGTYEVVIKAKTTWKDYFYTVKVNVQ